MPQWVPFIYCDFYDQPRRLITTAGDRRYLFTCDLDEELDEFPDYYTVYLMPPIEPSELVGAWSGLEHRALRSIGSVKLTQASFDTSFRKAIDLNVLQNLNAHASATPPSP